MRGSLFLAGQCTVCFRSCVNTGAQITEVQSCKSISGLPKIHIDLELLSRRTIHGFYHTFNRLSLNMNISGGAADSFFKLRFLHSQLPDSLLRLLCIILETCE